MIGCALVILVGLFSFPRLLLGSDQTRVKEMIQNNCAGCHRLEGKADSRFNLKAPDLIWAGSKYQRSWLLRYLTGKEAPLYPKGYRWDLSEGPTRHPVVTEDEAQGIAEYFEQHNKDPRVKVGAFDVSKISKFDATFTNRFLRKETITVTLACSDDASDAGVAEHVLRRLRVEEGARLRELGAQPDGVRGFTEPVQ